MAADAEDVADIMERVTNATKHIIFTKVDFVIHDRPIQLTVLCVLQGLPSSTVNVVYLKDHDIVTSAV